MPVLVHHKEEHEIDFRVPGLSHGIVKEAEHLQVQEIVKKIETHPHREALQADLQQNNISNPSSKNSKEMIRGLVKWSYSSCSKLYPKCNAKNAFFIKVKE